MVFLAPALLAALPQDGKAAQGSAAFSHPDPQTLIITIPDDKAILHYSSFNIGEKETVQFQQKSSSSAVLNRVTGRDPSKILGRLQANGKVFLINPNGIVFGPNSKISTGSLIASTLDIEDKDFLEGKSHKFFSKPGFKPSQIINQGVLSADPEGIIALIAPIIQDKGTIQAQACKIALLAAEKAVIDFTGDGLVTFAVEGAAEAAIIEHLGKISAPQGEVFLHLKTADNLIKSVVNVDGLLEGNTVVKENGITRIAHSSQIEAGKVSIAGNNVEVLGEVSAKEKFEIKAENTVRIRDCKQEGGLSIKGKVIAISGPIESQTLQISAAAHYQVGANITARSGPMIFDAPVLLTAQNIQLTAGKIVFKETLSGDPKHSGIRLSLAAKTGDIYFGAAVGDLGPLELITVSSARNVTAKGAVHAGGFIQHQGSGTTKFDGPLYLDGDQGLNLNCFILDINNNVEVKKAGVSIVNSGRAKIAEKVKLDISGPFVQKGEGETLLGGNITTPSSISFLGPILLIDTVFLNGSQIAFHANIEGSGGLDLKSGKLSFLGDIGQSSPLSMLKGESSSSISLKNIGGERPGVTGDIELTAKDGIYFDGTKIHANAQEYVAAKEFRMRAHLPTTFISSSSNTPVAFKDSSVFLEEGSDLAISTLSGDVSLEAVHGTKLQNLSIHTNDGLVSLQSIGEGEEINDFSVTGKTVDLLGPIQVRSANIGAKNRVNVHTNIRTSGGHLTFDGPVFNVNPGLEFTTSLKGDIIFNSSIQGTGKFGLNAGDGIVRFHGPIGDKKVRFAELVVSAKAVYQHASVQVTGQVFYTGEIHLGGDLKTWSNQITFNGPVIRDHIDHVTVNTSAGPGNVIFKSTLNADTPDRSLTLTTNDGSIYFKGDIGLIGPLRELNLSGKAFSFQNIGGEEPGISTKLTANAKERVDFHGVRYHAKQQTWDARDYTFHAGESTEVISDGKKLHFTGGVIELKEGVHFTANSQGGELKILGISAPALENITLIAESGDAHIGSISDHAGALKISAYDVHIEDEVRAKSIRINASESILSSYNFAKIVSEGDILLNAVHGSIGHLEKPVWVASDGKVTVGAHGVAVLKGTSVDGFIHPYAANLPSQIFFNGNEYYNRAFANFQSSEQQGEKISITPDLYTGVPADSVSSAAVRPRRVPLYWQPQK